jgi:hypothetical protein
MELLKASKQPSNLVPIYMKYDLSIFHFEPELMIFLRSANTGIFLDSADIRLGSRGDSYYEYLLCVYSRIFGVCLFS